MKKLSNTDDDRKMLHDLIESGVRPLAMFDLGKAHDNQMDLHKKGRVQSVDVIDGKCTWSSKQNPNNFPINIAAITLINSISLC